MGKNEDKDLITAVTKQDESRVRELLFARKEKNRANPNTLSNEKGKDPEFRQHILDIAVRHGGDANIVRLLLEAGTNVSEADYYGTTPLHIAAEKDNVKVINLLLAFGAEVDVTCNNGWTPLLYAIASGHIEVIDTLLAQGADVHKDYRPNDTPLHIAVVYGHTEIGLCCK